MRITRTLLRSAPGQLGLLGVLYAGAVVLGVAAWCLRPVLFEPYIRERFPPLSEAQAALARELAGGAANVSASDVSGLYGAWIDDPALDPHGRLAAALLAGHGGQVLESVRRTVVVGDAAQRARAVALLGSIRADDLKPRAAALCRFAQVKAERRGETELAAQAAAALARLEADP
jgi:hypothetical protein